MSIQTTESPPTDVMAKARGISHAPLGNSRRRLAWAEKRFDKCKRDLAAAQAHLEKCEATVRYYEELARVDASADSTAASA